MEAEMDFTLLNRDDLPRDADTFEFEGIRFPDTAVSFICARSTYMSRENSSRTG